MNNSLAEVRPELVPEWSEKNLPLKPDEITFNEMADIVRLYSKKPKTAEQRLANLLSEVLYEDSESV